MSKLRVVLLCAAMFLLSTPWLAGQDKKDSDKDPKAGEPAAKAKGQLPTYWKQLGLSDDQPQHVALAAFQQARRHPDRLDPAQVEQPLRPEKPAVEALVVFRPPAGPSFGRPGQAQHDRVARVPANLQPRLHLLHQGEQPRQQRPVPAQFPARWETLLAEVPALAVDLPG